MIGRLRGVIIEATPEVLLEVGGWDMRFICP